eukprot:3576393-Amphidinium_carterae.1
MAKGKANKGPAGKKPGGSLDRNRVCGSAWAWSVVGAALSALCAGWYGLQRLDPQGVAAVQEEGVARSAQSKAVVQPQLLQRLIEILQRVQAVQQEHTSETDLQAVMKEAELELVQIEQQLDTSSASGKQGMAILGLVHAALKSEQDGGNGSFSAWTEEALFKEHGLVTYESQSYWDEAYGAG